MAGGSGTEPFSPTIRLGDSVLRVEAAQILLLAIAGTCNFNRSIVLAGQQYHEVTQIKHVGWVMQDSGVVVIEMR